MGCPHCKAEVDPAAFYCGACGMAVRVSYVGPRVVHELRNAAMSVAGQSMQMDVIAKHTRSAFSTLMKLGGFLIIAGVAVELLRSLVKGTPNAKAMGLLTLFLPGSGFAGMGVVPIGMICGLLGVFFVALAVWSRYEPLHAAVTGAIMFIAFVCLEGTTRPTAIADAVIMKIIIIGALYSAVKAGLAHRRLQNAVSQASPDVAARSGGATP